MINLRIATQWTLECLHSETGSYGSGAEDAVKQFIENPEGAESSQFGYVSGLSLGRFYIDPTKPNDLERQSLWTRLQEKFSKLAVPAPPSINSKTSVRTLRNMINEA